MKINLILDVNPNVSSTLGFLDSCMYFFYVFSV